MSSEAAGKIVESILTDSQKKADQIIKEAEERAKLRSQNREK